MPKTKFTMPDGEIVEKDFPQWKTPWNHDTNFESDRTATFTPEESLTKQEFKDETDINVILARFARTKEEPPIILPEHFADTSTRTTYYEMASAAAQANDLFYTLPADKRAIFQNDPTQWADAVVEAVEQGDRASLQNLGIAVPPVKPQVAMRDDPPPPDTPAAETAPKAPGAPTGAKPPQPPSDTGKN